MGFQLHIRLKILLTVKIDCKLRQWGNEFQFLNLTFTLVNNVKKRKFFWDTKKPAIVLNVSLYHQHRVQSLTVCLTNSQPGLS